MFNKVVSLNITKSLIQQSIKKLDLYFAALNYGLVNKGGIQIHWRQTPIYLGFITSNDLLHKTANELAKNRDLSLADFFLKSIAENKHMSVTRHQRVLIFKLLESRIHLDKKGNPFYPLRHKYDYSIDKLPRFDSVSDLVFDIGNVLVYWSNEKLYAAFLAVNPLLPRKKFDIFADRFIDLFNAGKITSQQFARALRRLLNKPNIPERQLIDIYNKIHLSQLPPSTSLLGQLKAGHMLSAISNTSSWASSHILGHDWARHFRHVITSFSVQSMKPEVKIFDVWQKVTGRDFSGALFFDDSPTIVEHANLMGLKTVLVPVKDQGKSLHLFLKKHFI
ncbi:MAG: HAD-IA family hydrolase [Candidatus Margulisbacteria bacterium]|nr:HAD-IA family hydrolase [Candidatus Margulisiibacteriota bacterium]